MHQSMQKSKLSKKDILLPKLTMHTECLTLHFLPEWLVICHGINPAPRLYLFKIPGENFADF